MPQDATSFTHRVFTDVIKLKMRALGWILIHSDLCPYKKRPHGHRHGEDSVKTHRDTTTLASQGGGPGTEPFLTALRRTPPCQCLDFGLPASRTWVLCHSSHRKLIRAAWPPLTSDPQLSCAHPHPPPARTQRFTQRALDRTQVRVPIPRGTSRKGQLRPAALPSASEEGRLEHMADSQTSSQRTRPPRGATGTCLHSASSKPDSSSPSLSRCVPTSALGIHGMSRRPGKRAQNPSPSRPSPSRSSIPVPSPEEVSFMPVLFFPRPLAST